mmetsp:Transcript_17142/g.50697  ORF Transcript_17142/g.50697 Transcript_17142/m.50697 type:complete len:272 (+) Transcript_17142:288-1103(+)
MRSLRGVDATARRDRSAASAAVDAPRFSAQERALAERVGLPGLLEQRVGEADRGHVRYRLGVDAATHSHQEVHARVLRHVRPRRPGAYVLTLHEHHLEARDKPAVAGRTRRRRDEPAPGFGDAQVVALRVDLEHGPRQPRRQDREDRDERHRRDLALTASVGAPELVRRARREERPAGAGDALPERGRAPGLRDGRVYREVAPRLALEDVAVDVGRDRRVRRRHRLEEYHGRIGEEGVRARRGAPREPEEHAVARADVDDDARRVGGERDA